MQAFESGTSVIGTTWQLIANTIGPDDKVKVNTVLPKEGSTGWSDTWMLSAKAAHLQLQTDCRRAGVADAARRR